MSWQVRKIWETAWLLTLDMWNCSRQRMQLLGDRRGADRHGTGYRKDPGNGFKPGYDPVTFFRTGRLFTDSSITGQLVKRETAGLYPPPDRLKIVTALSIWEGAS